jgi:hypothetical protein
MQRESGEVPCRPTPNYENGFLNPAAACRHLVGNLESTMMRPTSRNQFIGTKRVCVLSVAWISKITTKFWTATATATAAWFKSFETSSASF